MVSTNLIISNIVIKHLTCSGFNIPNGLNILALVVSSLTAIITLFIACKVYHYTRKLNKNIHFPALFNDLLLNHQMWIEKRNNEYILKILENGQERDATEEEKYLQMKNMKDLPTVDFSWKMYWYPYSEEDKNLITDVKEIEIKEKNILKYDKDLHVLLNCDPFSIGMKDLLNTDKIKNSVDKTYMLVIVLLCKDANGEKFKINNSPFFYFYKTEVTKVKEEDNINKFQFFKEHKNQKYVDELRKKVRDLKS